jgi:hypothetical protein
MLRPVALVRTEVSGQLSTSFIRATRISELGTKLGVTSNRCTLLRNAITWQRASVASYSYCCCLFTDSCHPDEGSAKFLLNVGSDKSHRA